MIQGRDEKKSGLFSRVTSIHKGKNRTQIGLFHLYRRDGKQNIFKNINTKKNKSPKINQRITGAELRKKSYLQKKQRNERFIYIQWVSTEDICSMGKYEQVMKIQVQWENMSR